MPKHTTPAARASHAAGQTIHTKQHLAKHRKHRERHAVVALAGGALLGGEPDPAASRLVAETIREFGTRLPLTPKEAAAVESLIADHDSPPSLTRRDPNETGPVLADFGSDVYVIDGDVVTKVKA